MFKAPVPFAVKPGQVYHHPPTPQPPNPQFHKEFVNQNSDSSLHAHMCNE